MVDELQEVAARALRAGVMLTLQPPHDTRSAGLYVIEAYCHATHGGVRAKKIVNVEALGNLAPVVEALVLEVLGPDDGSDLV